VTFLAIQYHVDQAPDASDLDMVPFAAGFMAFFVGFDKS
jgi:hypothetical protein